MLKGGIICVLLNFFDLLFTITSLRMNIIEEKNFILHWYYSFFGIFGIVAFKLLAVALLILAVEFSWRNRKITMEKAKNYYATANLIFILPFCFFTGIINFPGCDMRNLIF